MTKQEAEETKKHRKEALDALLEMRDMMISSENWESMERLISAVTMGAFAIIRINDIDFGKENE